MHGWLDVVDLQIAVLFMYTMLRVWYAKTSMLSVLILMVSVRCGTLPAYMLSVGILLADVLLLKVVFGG